MSFETVARRQCWWKTWRSHTGVWSRNSGNEGLTSTCPHPENSSWGTSSSRRWCLPLPSSALDSAREEANKHCLQNKNRFFAVEISARASGNMWGIQASLISDTIYKRPWSSILQNKKCQRSQNTTRQKHIYVTESMLNISKTIRRRSLVKHSLKLLIHSLTLSDWNVFVVSWFWHSLCCRKRSGSKQQVDDLYWQRL